ncbi:MAG TPA: lysylphosphatidylglycerol synthase transmembrane domain-containing protein [Terriglobia bacterium]|nr:lysylphosphatidylglycerol synthase transmembrane domain-containing protein [Terriglobia bacterium]
MVLFILLVAGVILLYQNFLLDFDWALFVSSLSTFHPGWLAASVAFSLMTYLLRAVRWRVLLAPVKRVPTGPLFWATIVGFAAIYILGRAAEFARPVWLTRTQQVPFTTSMATIIVERFLDALMLIAVFALALMTVELPGDAAVVLSSLKNAGWLVAGIAAASMALLFVLRSHVAWIAGYIRHTRFPAVAALVEDFARGLSFVGSTRILATVILHSAALWMVIALQSWFMFFAMRLDFSLAAVTLVMVAVAIGSLAQLPGIGGGFQVAWIFCTTTLLMLPAEQAAATALFAFVLSYAPTIIVAALYLLAQGISVREFTNSIRHTRSEFV